ncbi:MAG TPA: ROK family transcriptional regulator [Clostridiales bacterium]|nr:ROK family transcriptional regulator [Clostridiales bacterium]
MQKYLGNNSNVMKQKNRALILNIIKDEGGISRAELSKRTGLSRGGITPIVNELLSMELIVETGVSVTDSGRRPIILELNADGCHAIAVDWTRKKYTAALVDFTGRIITREQYWFTDNDTLDHILKRLKESINNILCQSKAKRIAGIGVVAPGPLDIYKGVILSPPNFWGWLNIPIKQILENEFKLPVFVDNNANAYALAEKNYGKGRQYHNFIYVVVDEGIGAGIIIEDDLYRGKGGFGSEIGHISINMDGPKCECGNNGCIEIYATIPQIMRHVNNYTELGVLSSYLNIIRSRRLLRWDDILNGLKIEDPVCMNIIRKIAVYLGNVFVSLINVLEPEAIFIGSDIASAGKHLLEPIKEYLHDRTVTKDIHKTDLLLSDLEHGSLIGGAMLVLQSFIDSGNYGIFE